MVIGVVVVTWNSADVIAECLDACLLLEGVHVVVVDNASTDATVEMVKARPRVRLIANPENRGFAAAVNQGVAALDYDSVLLLNPDAIPVKGLDLLAAAVQSPGIGAAGGALLDPSGKTQDGFNVRGFPQPWTLAFEALGWNRIAPWNPVNRRYRKAVRARSDVDQPAGAFLMINRNAWRTVGGFDEGFWPAWFEDVDFCLRLRNAGYRILYLPEASARHIGGHSASKLSWNSRQVFWYGSLLRYSAMHFPAAGRRLVSAAVMTASVPRGLLGIFGPGGLDAVSAYSNVFWLAFSCWQGGNALQRLQPGPRRINSSRIPS